MNCSKKIRVVLIGLCLINVIPVHASVQSLPQSGRSLWSSLYTVVKVVAVAGLAYGIYSLYDFYCNRVQKKHATQSYSSVYNVYEQTLFVPGNLLLFYHKKQEGEQLSNMHTLKIRPTFAYRDASGKTQTALCSTSEHWFQMHKFVKPNKQGYLVEVSPGILRKLGELDAGALFEATNSGRGRYKSRIRNDWQRISDEVMHEGLFYKFTQNYDCYAFLMQTGNRELVENSPDDTYWCGNNTLRVNGKPAASRLGISLMMLRRYLRDKASRYFVAHEHALPITDQATLTAAAVHFGTIDDYKDWLK